MFPDDLLKDQWVMRYKLADLSFTEPFPYQGVLTFVRDPDAPSLPPGETWLIAEGSGSTGEFGPMRARVFVGTHVGFREDGVDGGFVPLTSFCLTQESAPTGPIPHAYYSVWSGFHQVYAGGNTPGDMTHSQTIRGFWTDFEQNAGSFELMRA